LGEQLQFEFLQQEAELGLGLGVAAEQQFAAVGGRQVLSFRCGRATASAAQLAE
jgi:hypothetical protein